MKEKYKLNIDYLKLCYRQPDGIFDAIAGTLGDIFYGDGYELRITERDISILRAEVLIQHDGELMSLGTLMLNNGSRFMGKAFFEYSNRAFYETSTMFPDKANYIPYFDYIAGDLGLEYNNCTRVDIALDTNINVLARVKKNIRNHEGLDMYLCRHKVVDADEKLPGYGEYYASTRKRLIKRPEIIIEQAKDEGTRLKMYDKTRELVEHRDDKADLYYSWLGEDWNREKDHINRLEVSIRNEDLKDIYKKCRDRFLPEMQDLPFWLQMTNEKWLTAYFYEGLSSLLYFRDRATGEKVEAF